MNKINEIQSAILELDGGSYQKMMDAYFYKKYKFDNIQTLGSQTATNKVTKGIPDSYIEDGNGKYIFIMYGSVESRPYTKIKDDILSIFEKGNLRIKQSKIKEIICAYTSTNLKVEQLEELKNLKKNIKITLVGIGTVSHDLLLNYPAIASDFLNISIDTDQIFDIDEFIDRYDKSQINPSLKFEFKYRKKEFNEIVQSVNKYELTAITGQSGVGKTKLGLEVCKSFKDEGYEVLCIKNNGQQLYDDIRSYTSDKKRYLLFIDDANFTSSLDYIFSRTQNPLNGSKIRIIITIRDYAKKHVFEVINKYFKFTTIDVPEFKRDELIDILKSDMKINDNEALDTIYEISKGNVRLALMAGSSLKKNGNVPTDIFRTYYDFIISNEGLTKNELRVLFIVALIPNTEITGNDFAKKILKEFNIGVNEFDDICRDLNEKELIDIYLNKLVKINDQSFGDYLLRYILLDKKAMSIEHVLNFGFPENKSLIIYAIRTLLILFPNEETLNYIKSEIEIAWNNSDEDYHDQYLECFFQLLPVKSLVIIKQKFEKLGYESFNLSSINFEKEKNNGIIKNKYIEILSKFKNTQYYKEATELLCIIFSKRPDWAMDIYTSITNNMIFNTGSYRDDYSKELSIVKILKENLVDKDTDGNGIILYIQIIKEFLKCRFDSVESTFVARTVTIASFGLSCTDGLRKIRELIWKSLSEIFSKFNYRNKEDFRILTTNYSSGIEKKYYIPIFEFDLICQKRYFFDDWKGMEIEKSVILSVLNKRSKRIGATFDKSLLVYENDPVIHMYELMSCGILGSKRAKRIETRNKSIKKLISNYSIEQYDNLFIALNRIEKLNIDNVSYGIGSSLGYMFSIIGNKIKYVEVVKKYFLRGLPFNGFGSLQFSVISGLLNQLDFKNSLDVLTENISNNNIWISNLFEINQKIDSFAISKIIEFFEEQSINDNPYVPELTKLENYFSFDKNLLRKICDIILNSKKCKTKLVNSFFRSIQNEEESNKLIRLFEGNYELLERLYMVESDIFFDYEGFVLENLIIGVFI